MNGKFELPPGGPKDRRAMAAIDLGAESCRISLLRWDGELPRIELVHRIANGPEQLGDSLRWPLDRILDGVKDGLRRAAAMAPEGIRSVAVDGWAVDYVRLASPGDPEAPPLHAPFCYRDERTVEAKAAADERMAPEEVFARTGAQPLRINTLYQLVADSRAGIDPRVPWILLPEYVLYRLGGRRIAEYTNATHTGLVDLATGDWSRPVFERLGLAIEAAPPIVPAGTVLGKLGGELASLPAFAETLLIAPACHDTASAIAAVPEDMCHTAYLICGTWSLVGTTVDRPIATSEALRDGFTNQGAAAGGFCFHANVNGMWLLKQCLDGWRALGREIDLKALVAQAAEAAATPGVFDVDTPELLLAGRMPKRINGVLARTGLREIPDVPGNEALFARAIFASLALRYATVLARLAEHTGRNFHRIAMLGGGSRNALLRRLTAEAARLPVHAGEAEGSTLGNFAVQLAALEDGAPLSAKAVRAWAARLSSLR